ncbi:MAG: RodZ domain-containing protein [Thermodesulfobacteriota bacterium]
MTTKVAGSGKEGGRNAPELSFGRYLGLRREEKGLTKQEVAAELRLTGTTVQWIEEENLDRLPPEVYVKGFLREYARLLDADPEQVVNLYLQCPGRRISEDAAGQVSARRRRLIIAVLAILIAAGIILLVRSVGHEEKRPEAPLLRMMPARNDTEPEPQARELSVNLRAEKDAAIKVMTDGGAPVAYHLKQGEGLVLKAKNKMNLLVPDPDSVRVLLDGKPVAVYARPGQATNIRIP